MSHFADDETIALLESLSAENAQLRAQVDDAEKRVAEACAKYCDNLKTYHAETGRPVLASVAEHAAYYLREGKWREYR